MLQDGQFEVTVQFGLDPSAARPEEIRVTMNGRFAPVGDRQEVSLESFAQFHAPAILMPFVREVVSGLTARGFFGALVLPPINVQSLMERQIAQAATANLRELNASNALLRGPENRDA
jgi:preprotein translocase subunit SecB